MHISSQLYRIQYNDLNELDFGDDSCCGIATYIKKRLGKNYLSVIVAINPQETFPTVYSLLQHSQPTMVSVKLSFLMLNKLLAKNFCQKTGGIMMYVHYNSNTKPVIDIA